MDSVICTSKDTTPVEFDENIETNDDTPETYCKEIDDMVKVYSGKRHVLNSHRHSGILLLKNTNWRIIPSKISGENRHPKDFIIYSFGNKLEVSMYAVFIGNMEKGSGPWMKVVFTPQVVEPLFIKLTTKNSSLCVILDSIPELLYVDGRNSSSECFEKVRVLENVDTYLKDKVLLSLLKIKYTVALPNRHPRAVR
ncbi:hypothetical protein Tco_1349643 [Tanacetum coccineum]